MLQYHRIEDHFFMDTLFATKKGGKLSRGNKCCQLFVTDKRFLHMVPMKRKSKVFMTVKMFAKEIGAPNAIVCNMAKEQTSAELKGFLNDIGTTLHALEEGTPWANKAELYIKLSDILSKHWEFSKVFHIIRDLFDFQGKITLIQ